MVKARSAELVACGVIGNIPGGEEVVAEHRAEIEFFAQILIDQQQEVGVDIAIVGALLFHTAGGGGGGIDIDSGLIPVVVVIQTEFPGGGEPGQDVPAQVHISDHPVYLIAERVFIDRPEGAVVDARPVAPLGSVRQLIGGRLVGGIAARKAVADIEGRRIAHKTQHHSGDIGSPLNAVASGVDIVELHPYFHIFGNLGR